MRPLFQFACLIALVAAAVAQTVTLPKIEGESFTGRKVVLPDDAKGKTAVLIFGFTRASKDPTGAWADKIFADFGSHPGFVLYQLPVLEEVPRFIRGMVISGIKKGVRENMRDHFVPVLRGEADLKKFVNYAEADDAYLVTLDSAGQIVDQHHGPLTDAAYGTLHSKIQSLLDHTK